MIKRWQQLSSETINENRWGGYYHDRFRTGDGVESDYFYHVNRNAVDVVVMIDREHFVMLREYRYLFDKISLSNVMGGIEEGEDPETTARREVEEEVGYIPGKMELIGGFSTAPAFSKEHCTVFLATELQKSEVKSDACEHTEPVIMTAAEIDEAIASGEIWDSNVMATWQLAKFWLEKNQHSS